MSGEEHAPVKAPALSLSQVVDECVICMSMIEVTARALEENQSAVSEQLVLKGALKKLWIIHEYLSDLPASAGDARPVE